jgi:Bifunctional DNA primase/polymerase, N-terminal
MASSHINIYPANWRFTMVSGKAPFMKKWQNNPLEVHQTDSDFGIGLILGEQSGGVMALDLDGPTSFKWFDDNIGPLETILKPSVIWSSGKPSRMQIAFNVSDEYWDALSTKKFKTSDTLKEGIEFRWNGCQSVLPPSPHPETGFYKWVSDASPVNQTVEMIPDALLMFWLEQCVYVAPDVAPVAVDLSDQSISTCHEALTIIKNGCNRLDYSDWLVVFWGVASKVGADCAVVLMKEFFPPESPNEYEKLARTKPHSVTFGSVVNFARRFKPDFLKAGSLAAANRYNRMMEILKSGAT